MNICPPTVTKQIMSSPLFPSLLFEKSIFCDNGMISLAARFLLESCVLVALCVHQLYPSLCELAHVLSVDGPVKQRLDTLAGELAKAADKELQVGH